MALFRRNTLCIARKSDEIRAQIFQKMPKANCAVLPKLYRISFWGYNHDISTKESRKPVKSLTVSKMNLRRIAPWLILLLGLLARLWLFGEVPGGLNQDEAFAGYEAWSLLHSGMDTAGYRFPVYLTAWGSGMNALETYLMIPWIALFGLKVWVIRLPQLLMALLSLWVVFLLGRRLWGERAGLLCLLLTALCPWHILLSRWGLESNLAPGLLLFALYFFVRGLDDERCYPLSALCYGLSLYAYATIWPFVPLILLIECVAAIMWKKLRLNRWLFLSFAILAVFAAPLLLFLAVNLDRIGEIRTPFFSIPKLLYFRSGEMSFRSIPDNFRNLMQILITQSDGLAWNTAGAFGLLYPITLPFSLAGLIVCLIKLKKEPENVLILANLLAGLLLGLLIHVNVNRVNILFFPLILLAARGLDWLCGRWKPLLVAVLAVYLLFFAFFEQYYFTDYRRTMDYNFGEGLEEALAAIPDDGSIVTVSDTVKYPRVLFYTQTPTERFRGTVSYKRYPAAYLDAASFDRWRFGIDTHNPDAGRIYILSPWDDSTAFREAGFEMTRFGIYTVAKMP